MIALRRLSPRILLTLSTAWVLAPLAFVVASCAEPQSPVPLREGVLATGEAGRPLPADLRIVHAGPKGLAGAGEAPTVVFDRPLRELGDEASEAAPPVTLEPPLPGVWRWLGSQAAVFEPLRGFPGSTRFTLRVDSAATATDGARLVAPFEHAFESPRIQVQSAWIDDEEMRALDLRGGVRIRLTQAASVDSVAAAVALENNGRQVPVTVSAVRAEGDTDAPAAKVFLVVPRESLAEGSQVELRVADTLSGIEGPLPMREAFRATFDVIGEPKLVDSLCSARGEAGAGCAAAAALKLAFDAPVSVQALSGHLRIEPARSIRWPKSPEARARKGSTHWIDADFAPGETVTVTLTPGLTNARGRRLSKPIVNRVVFAPPTPQAQLGVFGTFVDPAAAPSAVVVRTQALSDVEVFSIPVATPAAFSLIAPDTDIAAALDGSATWRGFFQHRKVTWALGDTAKEGVVEMPTPTGPSLVGARYRLASGDLRTASHLVVPSKRVVSAHVGFDGGVVWATELATARPVSKVPVAIVDLSAGREVFRSATADDGTLVIPSLPRIASGLAGYAVVAFGDGGAPDSITRFEHGSWSYAYGVSSDTSERPALQAVLETDRDIYRPGDVVAFSAVLRERHALGLRTPIARPFKLVASDDRNDRFLEKNLTTSAFGTLHERVELPHELPLGSAHLELIEGEGDAAHAVAMTTVRVEQVRPAEFQVELKSDRDRFVAGEPIAVRGAGRYLFGAPMASVPVRFFVSRVASPSVISEDGASHDWTSGNDALRAARRDGNVMDGVVVERASASDAQGRALFEDTLALPKLEDDERITVEAEFKDLTGRTGAARTVLHAYASSQRVFLREPDDVVLKPKKPVLYGVRVVGMNDEDLVGANVEVRLLRFVDRTAKRVSDGGRVVHEELVREEQSVDACALRTSAARRGCALTPREAGQHVVEATVRDRLGRMHRSSFAMVVSEPRETPLFAEGDTRDLELVVGARTYKPGDVAKVLVKNPWPGALALVTVEREGVRRAFVRSLGAADTLDVPVDATMVPEVHLGVHLVRARKRAGAKGADTDRLARIGMTTIAVENPARELHVEVASAARTYAPGDAVEGTLRVVDALGQPVAAEVTVSAVDEGMIMLTGHEPPNVALEIDRFRPIAQQVVEPRFQLANFVRRAEGRSLARSFAEKGAEGGDGGESARSDFTPLAAFVTGLRTDAQGRASFRFTLPDTLTRYRLQALAVGEGDRYGHGKGSFEVKKTLMVRPFLPRVLRVGDDANARVAIQSSGVTGTLATGVTSNGGLEARVPARRELSESSGVSLPLNLRGVRAERGSVTLRAALGDARDAITLPLNVVEPRSTEVFATFGDATGAIAERIGDVRRYDAEGSSLSVYAFGSPFVGFEGVLRGVEAYPYDCSEQLASKMLAQLAFAGLQARLGEARPYDAASLARLASTLLARQEYSGWIPYWSGYPGDAPLSGYVLEVLTRAAHDGVAVGPRSLATLRQALVERVRDATGDERAYLLGSLVDGRGAAPDDQISQAIAGALGGAVSERNALSLVARAHVLRAAIRLGATKEVLADLLSAVESSVRVTGVEASVLAEHGYFGVDRNLAATAVVLRSIALADGKHRLVAPLSRTLVRTVLGAQQVNPRELALALQALEVTADASRPIASEVRVSLGALERTLSLGRPGATAETRFGFADFPNTGTRLELRAQGSYGYRVVLRALEASMPTKPVDRGMHLERRYTFLKASELESFEKMQLKRGASLEGTVGDLVMIERVLVNASPLDQVVLDDPLPGAFEVIDRSLETEGRFGTSAFADDGGGRYFDEPRHVERLRDRVRAVWVHLPPGVHRTTTLARVAFSGTFQAPPAQVEAMYEPDVRGRSGGAVLRIREP